MSEIYKRTEMLIGAENVEKLKNCHVAVFGVGGVGGFAVEALARAGIGKITIVDNDVVSESNINRQIIALQSTINRPKVEVMAQRIRDINPEIQVVCRQCFYLPETAGEFDFTQYDYVIDAVDTVTAKIQLIMSAKEAGVEIISCMGTGNKLDPTKFQIADIEKTSVCPLAKVMRKELRNRGIRKVKVLYSTETALPSVENSEKNGRVAPGSISFVPSVAGLIIAGEAIKELIQDKN